MTILTKNSKILSTKSAILERAGDTNTVIIGGRNYPYVQIGNQLWITENLDYQFDGLRIGDSSVNSSLLQAWYCNNDEVTYGWNGQRRGLLYTGYTKEYMVSNLHTLFPDGWRIPSTTDYDTLINFVGKNNYLDLNYEGGEDYGSWTGNNSTGFNIKPAGWSQGLQFNDLNSVGLHWTATSSYGKYFYYNQTTKQYFHYPDRSASIRLVKDA